MDGAYDKLFAKLRDQRFPPRPPYQGATDAAFERFQATLRADFPAWVE